MGWLSLNQNDNNQGNDGRIGNPRNEYNHTGNDAHGGAFRIDVGGARMVAIWKLVRVANRFASVLFNPEASRKADGKSIEASYVCRDANSIWWDKCSTSTFLLLPLIVVIK
ncbi:hypothetical protein Hdeb2414_s0047g00747971 [Helianthus debilis subsp. tardiflorus]